VGQATLAQHNKTYKGGQFMSTEENKALVQRSYDEFFNKANLALVDQFHTGDFVGHIPGLPPVQGLEALKQIASGYFSAFPDLHITLEDIVAEGDKVMTRVSWRGTHKGAFLGISATGKQVRVTGMYEYRIAAGKIAEWWDSSDNLGLMQQLGVIPAPGQAS
jgi:steroid delta-isomerase-like uncharacterized protein